MSEKKWHNFKEGDVVVFTFGYYYKEKLVGTIIRITKTKVEIKLGNRTHTMAYNQLRRVSIATEKDIQEFRESCTIDKARKYLRLLYNNTFSYELALEILKLKERK